MGNGKKVYQPAFGGDFPFFLSRQGKTEVLQVQFFRLAYDQKRLSHGSVCTEGGKLAQDASPTASSLGYWTLAYLPRNGRR